MPWEVIQTNPSDPVTHLNPTPTTPKPFISKDTLARYDNWAFKVFLCSTLFIVILSIEAIHSWPPLVKHASILLACILPTGMVILSRVPRWWAEKQFPKEILWVLVVFLLGLISSLSSENIWASLKATVLFMISGPFIFITTKYLFESRKNQDVFLWINILIMLTAGFYGIFEYYSSRNILLFSDNPLPAGASLLLLSACPLILLNRKTSLPFIFTYSLSLLLAIILIIILAKKGPILAMFLTVSFLVLTNKQKHLKFFFGIIFIAGATLFISDSAQNKYKNMIGLKIIAIPQSKLDSPGQRRTSSPILHPSEYRLEFSPTGSLRIRMENYFFAFHVFTNNPIWGVGFRANLVPYLDDYKQRFVKTLGTNRYQQHFESENTFENIIVAFLIELGILFTITYFGGLLYIVIMCFNKLRALPQKNTSGIFIMSVIFGFVFLSLTFDTLRFPNLNWMFHSFLGLMVSYTAKHSSESMVNIKN